MAVTEYHRVDTRFGEDPTCIGAQAVDESVVKLAASKAGIHKPSEGDAHVTGQYMSIDPYRHRMPQPAPQPCPDPGGIHESIAMREVKTPSLVCDDDGIMLDGNADLALEIGLMPWIVIPDHIRDRYAGISPFSQQALKAGESLWHEVTILDVVFEYVSKQIKMLDLVSHGPQKTYQIRLLPARLRGPRSPQMDVRDEKNHKQVGIDVAPAAMRALFFRARRQRW